MILLLTGAALGENLMLKSLIKTLVVGITLLPATLVMAETRVTYKSAKSTSSYYQMAVQIAQGMKAGSNGEVIVTVEES